jgi:hypothetical protein
MCLHPFELAACMAGSEKVRVASQPIRELKVPSKSCQAACGPVGALPCALQD